MLRTFAGFGHNDADLQRMMITLKDAVPAAKPGEFNMADLGFPTNSSQLYTKNT
jgi:hypothetical protein